MPRLQLITTNFTAGVLSPRLRGRADIDKFNSSMKAGDNTVVVRHGGATIRPPLKYLGGAADQAQAVRLIPFSFTRDSSYMLEFGHLYIRVWKADALVLDSGLPYVIPSPYTGAQLAALDFAQSMDTMILCHPDHPPQRLLRYSDNRWTIGAVPFNPAAIGEIGHRGSMTMAISNQAVGSGRTITAGSAFFLAADVGRTITWSGGSATITAVGSATSATATVDVGFSEASAAGNTWILEGTPQTTVTPSAGGGTTPVGTQITLTLSTAGWRSADLGSWVELNSGTAKITAVTNDTVVQAIIMTQLSTALAVPADAWVLRAPIWNQYDGYPATCTFHEQRLWFANTARYPQSLWGSRSGLYFDFTPGTNDDSGVYKTVSSNERNPILFLHSGQAMVILTADAEFEGKGGVEKPITQTNMQLPMITRWGSAPVRPVQIGTEVLYAQGGARVLRRMYPLTAGGFDSSEASIFSEQLFRHGIVAMTYQKVPESVLFFVCEDGTGLALTYSTEQNVYACTPVNTNGIIESMATVSVGPEDHTYAVVRRTVNGNQVRYIERLDWGDAWVEQDQVLNPHDCRKVQSDVTAKTTWDGLEYLEGKEVSVLADGIVQRDIVVSGGQITLTRPANQVSVGLPYEAVIQLEAPEVGTGTGTAQGQATSLHSIQLRLLASVGGTVQVGDNPAEDLPHRKLDTPVLDMPVPAFTGLQEVSASGWAKESLLTIRQDQPYPFFVLAVIRSITINAG